MTKPLQVTVVTGPPGCGKTTQFLAEMAQTPGRYLFAMPRNELIEERVHDLHRWASLSGTQPIIQAIHSGQAERIPVLRRVRDAATELGDAGHTILLISHEALMTVDLSGYAGWHLRIDEQPDGVVSNSFRIPASWRFFKAAYDLEPVQDTKWSKVRVVNDAHSIYDLLRDDIAGDLAGFHKKRMARPVRKGFVQAQLISLRQRIRPLGRAPAKMEIRAPWSS
jgi:hypothetical protein